MARIGKAEKLKRVTQVAQWLTSGMNRAQIIQYASEKTGWSVTDRQIDTYISDAYDFIVMQAQYSRPLELGKALARLGDIYTRCMKVQDYGKAIAAQRELNKLMSLYAPEQPRTILLGEIDPAQLRVLNDVLQQRGLSASDMFEAMIAELSSEDSTDE